MNGIITAPEMNCRHSPTFGYFFTTYVNMDVPENWDTSGHRA